MKVSRRQDYGDFNKTSEKMEIKTKFFSSMSVHEHL